MNLLFYTLQQVSCAILHTSSSHDFTHLRLGCGGVLTSLCLLTSLIFFLMLCSIRLLRMISHTFRWRGGCGNVSELAHIFDATLHTSSLLDRTYLRVLWGGVVTSLCTCSHLRCYAPHVFFMISHTFGYHRKNVKNKLLNAEIWNYVYQWQWRYNHRHALWQMVPKVLKEFCK